MPVNHWKASERKYQERPEEPWYDADHQIRHVRSDGMIRWKGEMAFIGDALQGQIVGLAEQENGHHLVRFMHRVLGVLRADGKFQAIAPPRSCFKREIPESHG
jgi:hypothetical protein